MPTIFAAELEQLAIEVFVRAGAPAADAGLVARLLVKSNLAGHDSHGVVRIPQYVEGIATGRLRPSAPLVVSDDGRPPRGCAAVSTSARWC